MTNRNRETEFYILSKAFVLKADMADKPNTFKFFCQISIACVTKRRGNSPFSLWLLSTNMNAY